MFGLEYVLAFIKVAFNVAFAIVSAIPFYFAWNCVAQQYLAAYIPAKFLYLPYWHIVAFFLVFTFVGEQVGKLMPKIMSISTSSTMKNE